MGKDSVPQFRSGQPLRAADLNAIVDGVVARIHAPNLYADSTGVYFRPAKGGSDAISRRSPLFLIVVARTAFDQTNDTFIGDVVWRPSGTDDPDPEQVGLTIDNFANVFYGEAGSAWFCVRQSPEDHYLAIQGICPQPVT